MDATTCDSPADRAALVHRLADDLGFALAGIAPAEPSDRAEKFRDWLARGAHGDMTFLENYLEERLDPRVLVPGAKAVICVADRYEGGRQEEEQVDSQHAVGRIARYAWGDDYHRVMKKRLHKLADTLRETWPDQEYRTAVDTGPVLEREHAVRAGLGWVAKHTLVINPQLGSWLLLGVIVTTLPLETAGAAEPDHCGTCTRCIDACPTQCITPYELDATRCVSYLTIEHRGEIDPALHEGMGSWIAGCDVCQEVCPFNDRSHGSGVKGQEAGGRRRRSGSSGNSASLVHPRYAPRSPAPTVPLLDVLNWTQDDRRDAFRGSALKRIKLDMLKRNALIAAGNHLKEHDAPELRQRVGELARDDAEPELVRHTAEQVLRSI